MNRPESLHDELATIIQAGFIAKETSHEIARKVCAHLVALHEQLEGVPTSELE